MNSDSPFFNCAYQQRYIHDMSPFQLLMWCRQGGKSAVTTAKIVFSCLENPRTNWIIMSRGERQAKEVMKSHVKKLLQIYNLSVEYTLMIQKEKVSSKKQKNFWEILEQVQENDIKSLEVELNNGSRIIAIPANPDTARGYTGNVWVDEFGIHPPDSAREIWAAMFPIASANNLQVIVSSTPQINNKKYNHKFYELITQTDNIWSKHITDIYQAVNDGLPRDISILRKGLNDEEIWAVEYELKWVDDDESAWLSLELISSAEDEKAGKPDNYMNGNVFIGIDIAVRGHLWVLIVLEEVGDVLWTREIITLENSTFFQQDCVLEGVFNRYKKVVKVCIDQTGMGEKPVEDAKRKYGDAAVDGIIFNSGSKLMLANAGKKCFEERKLRLPQGDRLLRNDLNKLRKHTTPSGNVQFLAEADKDGHADRTWALFLAIYAAESIPFEFGYTPVKTDYLNHDNSSDKIVIPRYWNP